ncbi:MAG: hypothetical protein QE271_01155 [Bacteriovoracaceae bacterium]|nr:hypothetical protein [Bacteriovoracaceae bacterium]
MLRHFIFFLSFFIISLNFAEAKKHKDKHKDNEMKFEKEIKLPRRIRHLKEVSHLNRCFREHKKPSAGKCSKKEIDIDDICRQAVPIAMDEFFATYASTSYFGDMNGSIKHAFSKYARFQLNQDKENYDVDHKKPKKKWQFWKKNPDLELAYADPALCTLPVLKYEDAAMIFYPAPSEVTCKVNRKTGSAKIEILLANSERKQSQYQAMTVVSDKEENGFRFHIDRTTASVTGGRVSGPEGSRTERFCYALPLPESNKVKFACNQNVKIKAGFFNSKGRPLDQKQTSFDIETPEEVCAAHKETAEQQPEVVRLTTEDVVKGAGGAKPETKPKVDPHNQNEKVDPNEKAATTETK